MRGFVKEVALMRHPANPRLRSETWGTRYLKTKKLSSKRSYGFSCFFDASLIHIEHLIAELEIFASSVFDAFDSSKAIS